MFRAMSTRRGYNKGYEELIKEEDPSAPLVEPKLIRNISVPVGKIFSPSRKVTSEQNFPATPQVNKEAKKASKIHPIFSLFETKKKKKATARPEFSRYIQYVREGGFGDVLQTTPPTPTPTRL